MLILSDTDIANLLSLDQIVSAVKEAMVAYEKGLASVQQRMHMDYGNNTFLCMPSFEKKYFGTKLVSVTPGNKNKNLPVTNGAMLLQLNGPAGRSCEIDVSTNMMNWTPWRTQINMIGTISILDNAATNSPSKFYRTVPIP